MARRKCLSMSISSRLDRALHRLGWIVRRLPASDVGRTAELVHLISQDNADGRAYRHAVRFWHPGMRPIVIDGLESQAMDQKQTATVVDILWNDAAAMAQLAALRSLELPDAWIGAGFVRNRVWDTLIGRSTRRSEDDVDVECMASPERPLPIEQRERARVAHAALATLREPQRNVVHQHWIEERPFPEIAFRLGVPITLGSDA